MCFKKRDDPQNCFCLNIYAQLGSVVERPLQCAVVEIDCGQFRHMPFSSLIRGKKVNAILFNLHFAPRFIAEKMFKKT